MPGRFAQDQGIAASEFSRQMRAAAALLEHQGKIKKKRPERLISLRHQCATSECSTSVCLLRFQEYAAGKTIRFSLLILAIGWSKQTEFG